VHIGPAWQALASVPKHLSCQRVGGAGTEKEAPRGAPGVRDWRALAVLAGLAAGRSRIAGGLRTCLEMSEVALSPTVRLPALAARFHRAAGAMLLRRGGSCGKGCDRNGCDCDGELTHERFSMLRWVVVFSNIKHR
jgi:hypothetical protein